MLGVRADLTHKDENTIPITKPITDVGLGYYQQSTENSDFTSELRLGLRNAAPRRRRTIARRTSIWDPNVEIHVDAGKPDFIPQPMARSPNSRPLIMNRAENEGPVGRSTTSPQPAHRAYAVVGSNSNHKSKYVLGVPMAQRSTASEGLVVTVAKEKEQVGSSKLRKEPGRRTLHVPSDDTTNTTVHRGAHVTESGFYAVRNQKPDISATLVTFSEEAQSGSLVNSRFRKMPRKSLAAAPRRAPLLQSSRVAQEISSRIDIVGSGGGKENMPPGGVLGQCKRKPSECLNIEVDSYKSKTCTSANHPTAIREANVNGTTAASRARAAGSRKRTSRVSIDGSNRIKMMKPSTGSSDARDTQTDQPEEICDISKLDKPLRSQIHSSRPRAFRASRVEKVPMKLCVPEVAQKPKQYRTTYPVLIDDILQPEMYEESWLSYQEAAITQLLNSLFERANQGVPSQIVDTHDLRKSILRAYQDEAFPILYKRLQASLLYGALSIPKDLLSQGLRLREDLGLRRKFLDLWLNTYHFETLRAAAEVIIGREVPKPSRPSNNSSGYKAERLTKTERRSLEAFFDKFMIRNEDTVRITTGLGTIGSIARGGDSHPGDVGSQGWSWRRTVLRSFMLIALLDRSKTSNDINTCLFLTSSPHKSTAAVLHALSGLLLPSLGDITRPLGHLNYQFSCVQYPLQEYTYIITNLATDLRDGVRLARLVEILLYPPSVLACVADNVTITMPTGELLTSTVEGKESWVLSHHLKFPCQGRAQKVYNVQVALSALNGVKGVGLIAEGIKANEIVDGYREKTVGLLWAIVGKWGLGTLVDWEELEKEIQRMKRLGSRFFKNDQADSEDEGELEYSEGLERYTLLLKLWASSIAKRHGLKVRNLTTSFADGKVFEKIVDEYEVHYSTSPSPPSCSRPQDLGLKLRRLGCSNYFGMAE
ncbi:MAG: hypothetical protein M1827_000892 [Pycnora praestabilis]|nr:MAG: hypothetical protein M1827_000892 [Pycnora praestabilis]